MADYQARYQAWCAGAKDEAVYEALLKMRDDARAQEESFYAELEFGTAGLRGVLGAGTNRMNVYVVRRATQGLADYLKTFADGPERGVAIAYDSRSCSDVFALECALVLAQNGVRAYLYDTLHSVPQLSFAVLRLKCKAGVVITASHNPPQYNGYKVYWEHGGQAGPEQAEEILRFIRAADYFDVRPIAREAALKSGLLTMLGQEMDEAYYAALGAVQLNAEEMRAHGGALKLVYTPLHGSGRVPVCEILRRSGVEPLVVAEQAEPDSRFPTVKAPNPEDPDAFRLGIELANKEGADVILATDPDSDRLGIAVRRPDGAFATLTGNQIGSLLLHYILSTRAARGTLPKNGLVVKSLVSTCMADAICARYGVELRTVLTGFRFISEQIAEAERTGEHTFLFGFEESYGFLAGTSARDKDAICAALLAGEACVHYGIQGKTLYQVLREMYAKYGFYQESVKSYTLEGKAGIERIRGAMEKLRQQPPKEFAGVPVEASEDLKTGLCCEQGKTRPAGFPTSDVLRYFLSDGAWLCVRPSGTEPKLKLYIGARAAREGEVDGLLARLTDAADALLRRELAIPERA